MADLGREDLNAAFKSIGVNNTYDSTSRDVLVAELEKATASGDTRAQQSIRRDMGRVTTGTTMADSSSPTYQPPRVGSVDVAGALSGSNAALGQLTSMQPDLEKAIFSSEEDRQKFAQQQTEATQAQAVALGQSATLQAEATIRTEEYHNQLLRAVGLDINDPNSLLQQELQKEAATRKQREDTDAEITRLEGINFYQNPIDFLMAQPQLQKLTAQYNSLARQENTASANITDMRNLGTTLVDKWKAQNADLLRGKAAADATAVAQQATAVAADINAKNAAGHAKALLDVWNERHNVFQSILGVESLQETERTRAQNEVDRNFWRNVQLEKRDGELADKKADREKATALATVISQYRRNINGSSLPELTAQDLKIMPIAEREMWYRVGLRGNYGNDYSQSVPFIQEFGNPAAAAEGGNGGLMAQVNNINKRVQDKAQEIIAREKAKNMNSPAMKPAEARQAAYTELYMQDAGLAGKGVDKSMVTGANPYALDFDSAAALAAATSKTGDPGIVYKTLLEAKQRNPSASLNNTFTPRMLLNEIEARVAAGVVNPKVASEQVANFFGSQAAATYNANGLKYFNLPPVKDWAVSPGPTGKQLVDLMNPTQLENYLTTTVAREKRIKATTPAFGIYN